VSSHLTLKKITFFVQVILCVNSRPALNDVTIFELQFLLQQVQRISTEFDQYISTNQLLGVENGSGSPCLNLRSVGDFYRSRELRKWMST